MIISGKVIEIIVVNTGREYRSSADPVLYKFEVSKIFKGEIKKEIIEIASEESGASCGYQFVLGKSYLVYARKSSHFSALTKNEFDFVTSLCDRNQLLEKVNKEELKKLKSLTYKNKK